MFSADPVDELCRSLAGDGPARSVLRRLREPAEVIEAAVALAAARGIAVTAWALEARLSQPPGRAHLTLGTTMPAGGRAVPARRAPAGFMPIAVDAGAGTVRWCDVTGLTCDDAFLENSIARALREPYRRLMVLETGLDALCETDPRVGPDGVIFHSSRSGSTLVCRLLREIEGTVVLAEPPVIDHLLQAPGLGDDIRRRWMGGLLASLVAPWRTSGHRVVIKYDAWAVRWLALLLDAAGSAPWAFVFREPAAVVASQMRMPGLVGAPGLLPPGMFGLTLEQALGMGQAAFAATVYACLVEDVLAAPGDVCLIDHADLPGAIDRLLSHFRLPVMQSEQEAMAQAAGMHAKRPGEPYDRRGDAAITPEIRAAVQGRASAAYAALRGRGSRP